MKSAQRAPVSPLQLRPRLCVITFWSSAVFVLRECFAWLLRGRCLLAFWSSSVNFSRLRRRFHEVAL